MQAFTYACKISCSAFKFGLVSRSEPTHEYFGRIISCGVQSSRRILMVHKCCLSVSRGMWCNVKPCPNCTDEPMAMSLCYMAST